MRVATINFPKAKNDGTLLTDAAKRFAVLLCATFGGFTAIEAQGGWTSESGELFLEPMTAYQVAMEDTSANRVALLELAHFVGKEAEQQAVYMVYPDGRAEIIETRHLWAGERQAAE